MADSFISSPKIAVEVSLIQNKKKSLNQLQLESIQINNEKKIAEEDESIFKEGGIESHQKVRM